MGRTSARRVSAAAETVGRTRGREAFTCTHDTSAQAGARKLTNEQRFSLSTYRGCAHSPLRSTHACPARTLWPHTVHTLQHAATRPCTLSSSGHVPSLHAWARTRVVIGGAAREPRRQPHHPAVQPCLLPSLSRWHGRRSACKAFLNEARDRRTARSARSARDKHETNRGKCQRAHCHYHQSRWSM